MVTRLLRVSRTATRLAAALLLIGTGAGCSTFTSSEPPVVDSVLVAALADLHLAGVRASLYEDLPQGTRDSVLAVHGLTPADFEAAIDHYVDRPDDYLELYNRVLDHLTEEAEQLPPPTF